LITGIPIFELSSSSKKSKLFHVNLFDIMHSFTIWLWISECQIPDLYYTMSDYSTDTNHNLLIDCSNYEFINCYIIFKQKPAHFCWAPPYNFFLVLSFSLSNFTNMLALSLNSLQFSHKPLCKLILYINHAHNNHAGPDRGIGPLRRAGDVCVSVSVPREM
jgi:hypothetical protein